MKALILTAALFALTCQQSREAVNLPPAHAQNQQRVNSPVPQSSPPTLDLILPYCELAMNPERYNGHTVRFKGNLYFFIHGAFIMDDRCSEEFPKKPSTPNWNFYDRRAAITIEDSGTGDRVFNALTSKSNTEVELVITATGKFLFREPCKREELCSDAVMDRSFFELQITDVEKIETRKRKL